MVYENAQTDRFVQSRGRDVRSRYYAAIRRLTIFNGSTYTLYVYTIYNSIRTAYGYCVMFVRKANSLITTVNSLKQSIIRCFDPFSVSDDIVRAHTYILLLRRRVNIFPENRNKRKNDSLLYINNIRVDFSSRFLSF